MAPLFELEHAPAEDGGASHFEAEMPSAPSNNSPLKEHSELVTGLTATPKSVPCSYLYDQLGSELYDKVRSRPLSMLCLRLSKLCWPCCGVVTA